MSLEARRSTPSPGPDRGRTLCAPARGRRSQLLPLLLLLLAAATPAWAGWLPAGSLTGDADRALDDVRLEPAPGISSWPPIASGLRPVRRAIEPVTNREPAAFAGAMGAHASSEIGPGLYALFGGALLAAAAAARLWRRAQRGAS